VIVVAGAVAGAYLVGGRSGDPASPGAESRTMLVVLPFQNLGAPEMEYFADGMTEEITGKLAGLSGLGVIGRSSALHYKNSGKSLKEIGGELGVSYVLEGTVRWEKLPSGETRVRVSPQLIRVSDATQMWSQPYEAVLSSVFTIQAEIAEKVATALDVTLMADERTSLRSSGTGDTEAYDLFLRGNAARARGYAERDFKLAREMFSRATERDPGFSAAHAALSYTLSDMYWFYHERSPEIVALSEQHARTAMELQPREPLGPEALGWYYYHCKLDYDQALVYFREAIRLRPQHARAYEGMGAVNRRKGDFEESRRNYAEAVRLSPRDGLILDQAAETLMLMRRFDEALDLLDRAARVSPEHELVTVARVWCVLAQRADTAQAVRYLLEAIEAGIPAKELQDNFAQIEVFSGKYESALRRLDPSEPAPVDDQFAYAPTSLMRAELLNLLGRTEEARGEAAAAESHLRAKIDGDPADPRYHAALGVTLALLGRNDEAIRSAQRAVDILPLEREAWRGALFVEQLAYVYAIVGEQDEAIDRLELLLSRPSRLSGSILRIDPAWNNLRRNPRFQKLVRQGA
jgi:TolB-like protein/Tfp pilus assembly protein PilF